MSISETLLLFQLITTIVLEYLRIHEKRNNRSP